VIHSATTRNKPAFRQAACCYDALTRAVWVASMGNEKNAIAEDRPQWVSIPPRRPCGRRARGSREREIGD
jgi:hypothetical protein